MRQANLVHWFEDDSKPNTFFFRSPFRSWRFLINTALVIMACTTMLICIWRYWDDLGFRYPAAIVFLFFQGALYPYLWALKRHSKINELYLADQIAEQPAGSALDQVLEVADDSIHDGFRNSSVLSGLLFLALVFWRLPHLR